MLGFFGSFDAAGGGFDRVFLLDLAAPAFDFEFVEDLADQSSECLGCHPRLSGSCPFSHHQTGPVTPGLAFVIWA